MSLQPLQRAWEQFVEEGVLKGDELPPAVALSWQRCRRRGLDPHRHAHSLRPPPALPASAHEHLALVRPAMEDLHQFVEGSGCVVVFANADGVVLDSVGDAPIAGELANLGLTPGASWSEEAMGTNALALALADAFPIQISGPAHFCAALHPYCGSAAPIHDSLGQSLGALAIFGRCADCHPHTLGMVTAAAQAVTNQLQMQLWLTSANELLSELTTILQTLSEGIMLLKADGTISQMNARAGQLLGLSLPRTAGRKLSEALEIPAVLAQALRTGREMNDEELSFHTSQGRVVCLCTLKVISKAIPVRELVAMRQPDGKGMTSWPQAPVLASGAADGFVLTLRSIERVQRLVHRMSGARARLTFANIVGESRPLVEAIRLARIAAGSSSNVLLHGETGVGKEIFAQSIHNASARVDGPFVAINCAAIPRELITSELFGYEGGSFTGADKQGRPGKFELAHGGTLFLDEIGDMPRDLQTSLLRAIETRTIMRIGGQSVVPVDVRIIAATHKDLTEEARQGNFRSDLYFRLNVFTIDVPALRQREGDIPLLAQHFIQQQSRALGRPLGITPEALAALAAYPWPGNVRELENSLERAIYIAQRAMITLEDLPEAVRMGLVRMPLPLIASSHEGQADAKEYAGTHVDRHQERARLKEERASAEAELILQTYRSTGGSLERTAQALGISRTTLWRKKVRYDLPIGHSVLTRPD
ncbi:MAG TPA: sigma 54-interacting transcriptional regulator [Ktedonobacterales bacterium]|nr:sigma 54-interacting transcriptional regulator [Ktedonobacterales bacterium]